jgi:hypothetical protein
LIESIRKTFNSYSKTPFLFVWSSIMYVIMLFVFLFASLGLLIAYFITLSVFNQPLDTGSPVTLAIFGIIALMFLFFANGLNAALARAYHSAYWKERTSLTRFYSYALDKAPEMFGIMLLRDLLWIVVAGPAIAAYVFLLRDVAFMDILLYVYLLSVTFVIHMVFTPAFLSAGAFGTGLFSSMRHGFDFLRKKHINFIGIYIVFALMWLLNFVPFIQLATVFILYPIIYAAMVVMMEDSIKLERVED